ncbi:hypothetical protein Hanom_Chr10g00910071 [Helianthus anomalus]
MFGIIFSLQPDILERIMFVVGKFGALGDPSCNAVKTAPTVVVMAGKAKKTEKPVTAPVKQVASGTFCPRIRNSEDYIIVFNTLEGLGVPGSYSGVGGAGACTGPLIGQKRKGDTATVGGSNKVSLCRPRRQRLARVCPRYL